VSHRDPAIRKSIVVTTELMPNAKCQSFQSFSGVVIYHLNKSEAVFTYNEIFERQIYLRHGIELHEESCVFDVGANIGLFTIYVQERFPRTKVFAFEPSPDVVFILRRNCAKYGENVKIYSCGLSDECRQAVFHFYPGYSILSGFHADEVRDGTTLRTGILNQWRERYPGRPEPEERLLEGMIEEALGGKQTYQCQLRTVTDVIAENGIDGISLLKIDVEGSEIEVLRGKSASDWEKIRQIVIEVHDSKEVLPRVLELLASKSFHCVVDEEPNFASSGVVNCYARRAH